MTPPRYPLRLSTQERVEFSQILTLHQMLQLDKSHQKRSVDGIRFERFVGYLFEQEGYKVWTTRRVGDGGVDLFIRKKEAEYIVQCKRIQSGVVKPNDVWSMPTVMKRFGVKKAYLVTTGQVSSNTKQVAADTFRDYTIIYKEKDDLVAWARQMGSLSALPPAEQPPIVQWLERNQSWLLNQKLARAFFAVAALLFFSVLLIFLLTLQNPAPTQLSKVAAFSPASRTTTPTRTTQTFVEANTNIPQTPSVTAVLTPQVVATPTPPDEAAAPCKPGQVKGNANPDSRFYHEPGWIYYATVRPPEYTVRCFDNALTARAEGFRRGDTRPAQPKSTP